MAQRVQVWSGDRSQDLGLGTYIGEVTTYAVQLRDGSLWSFPDAERCPTADEVAEWDGKLVVEEGNPKIRLDDGRVVYGIQVWWQEV